MTIGLFLEAVDRAYDRRSWHGPNLRSSLRGVTAREAALRPGRGRHSIRDLAWHAAYWKYIAYRLITGGKIEFPRAGSNFPKERRFSPSEWEADLRMLDALHRKLRRAVARLRPPQLTPRRRKLILGIAFHDVYHAGQIRLVRRLIGKPR